MLNFKKDNQRVRKELSVYLSFILCVGACLVLIRSFNFDFTVCLPAVPIAL